MADHDSPLAKRKKAAAARRARAKEAYDKMSPEDQRKVNIGTNFSLGGTYEERQTRNTEYRAKAHGAFTRKKGGTIEYAEHDEE